MVAMVDDPELGTTTQIGVPINLLGTPGAIQGPQPLPGRAQHRDLRRARLHATTRSPRSARGGGLMHALEGVTVVDFGQYLAGPFGPMILGDLGADVIKVEPVTGDGMRMASEAVLRLPARQARHRAQHQEPERPRDRARAGRPADIVHHNMTAGVANKLGIGYEDCKRGQPRRRLLQHLGVRARRAARALRRPRPAVPGRGRARVRAGRGARGQHAALLPLRDVRHRQRDALGRRRASPRCSTSAAPARDRSCGRRCSTAARCSRPTRCSSTAKPCRGPGSTRTRPASTRATASTAPRTAGSRSRRWKEEH